MVSVPCKITTPSYFLIFECTKFASVTQFSGCICAESMRKRLAVSMSAMALSLGRPFRNSSVV